MAVNGNTASSFNTHTILEDLIKAEDSSKFELISKIWPNSDLSLEDFQDADYPSFISYVKEELALLRSAESNFAAQSLDGTINLIQDLRTNFGRPQEYILQLLRDRFKGVEDADILRSMDLATRLLLTLNVHSESVGAIRVQENVGIIEWPSNLSLRDLVASQVPPIPRSTKKVSQAELDPTFTAAALVNICGIKIFWTHNLADHLTLDKKRRILTVYEHKVCLLNHSLDKSKSPVIPLSAANEAIDTLNLLFPFGHDPTRELLHRELKMPLYSLGFCKRPRRARLTDFNIWQSRIADLVEAYNEPPKDMKQLLNDRRNVTNWWTAWLGILVLILTLVSIAFGTVSTVYGIKQYNLALAQACSVENSAQLLPKYCG